MKITLKKIIKEEKIDIMNDYRKKVKQFEQRAQQYRSEEAGRTGRDDGRDRRAGDGVLRRSGPKADRADHRSR